MISVAVLVLSWLPALKSLTLGDCERATQLSAVFEKLPSKLRATTGLVSGVGVSSGGVSSLGVASGDSFCFWARAWSCAKSRSCVGEVGLRQPLRKKVVKKTPARARAKAAPPERNRG